MVDNFELLQGIKPSDTDQSVPKYHHVSTREKNESYDLSELSLTGDHAESATQQVFILDGQHFNILDHIQFNNSYNKPYSKLDYESNVYSCTLNHLKILKHQSERSSVKLQEFIKLCLLMFDKKFNDVAFMSSLADDLGFRDGQEFKDFMNINKSNLKPRGRPMSGVVDRQLMYNFWKDESEISNDRRNAHHMIKVNSAKKDNAVVDLVDDDIKECLTKGGLKHKVAKNYL